jgi:hypothetical protein
VVYCYSYLALLELQLVNLKQTIDNITSVIMLVPLQLETSPSYGITTNRK